MQDAYARLRRRNPFAEARAKFLTSGQFQALRQLLLMTQAEAGKYLSDPPVTERAVQYWEAGKRAIPDDVSRSVLLLVAERRQQLDKALAACRSDPNGAVGIWYRTAEDWARRGTDEHYWKMHNSVVATLYGADLIHLVVFDAAAYSSWSRGQPKLVVRDEYKRHLEWALTVIEDMRE